MAGGGDPGELVVHLEPASDLDGIAVKWGIGNKYATPEECAKDCWCEAGARRGKGKASHHFEGEAVWHGLRAAGAEAEWLMGARAGPAKNNETPGAPQAQAAGASA